MYKFNANQSIFLYKQKKKTVNPLKKRWLYGLRSCGSNFLAGFDLNHWESALRQCVTKQVEHSTQKQTLLKDSSATYLQEPKKVELLLLLGFAINREHFVLPSTRPRSARAPRVSRRRLADGYRPGNPKLPVPRTTTAWSPRPITLALIPISDSRGLVGPKKKWTGVTAGGVWF